VCSSDLSNDCKPSLHPFTYLARDWYNIGSARQQGYEIQVKWQPGPRTQILAN
jgi:outer membrane receptor protein involved in Fe transport